MYTQSHPAGPENHTGDLLAGLTPPGYSNQAVANSEEKILTLLMCDIVDSTKLSTNLSANDMRSLLIDYYSICAEDLNNFGGRLIECIGDGVLGVFDRDDPKQNALNAANAAIELRQKVTELDVPLDSPKSLAVRISVVSGAGVLALNELLGQEAVFGQLPFIAHRLQQTAGTDGIVFNENAACMIGPQKDLVRTRKLKLRGFAQKASAWKLCSAGDKGDRKKESGVGYI